MSTLGWNACGLFLHAIEPRLFAQFGATALSDWTDRLFGLVLLVLLLQILFIQFVLVVKIMGNCRYMLLFLFLAGSLLLPTLSGTFDRSGSSDQDGQPVTVSHQNESSGVVTSEISDLRKERQSVVATSTPPRSSRPVRVTAPVPEIPRKPTARPVVAHNLNSSGQTEPLCTGPRKGQVQAVSASDNNKKFTTVSQPYYNHSNHSENRTAERPAPQPVTLRGNLLPQNVPANRVNIPTPAPLSAAPSPPAATGTLIPRSTPSPDPGISSAGFVTPQQTIPRPTIPLPGTSQGLLPPSQSGNVDTYRYLLEYFSEVMYQGIAAARPAVVHIEARVLKESSMGKRREVEETGCGVLALLQQRFFVITNAHVAGRAVANDQVRIALANQQIIHPIRILTCGEIDIALLEIDPSSLPPDILQGTADVRVARFGNSDAVRVPDTVLTIGSPFGLPGSVSRGVLSGRERRRIPLGNKPDQIQDFLQTDAAVNPGNSGGPLLNVSGEVIGIVTAIATNSGGSEGVAFAQPINNVLLVANQLIVQGVFRRPYMGVELDPEFDARARAGYGLNRAIGTRIVDVNPRSPADQAGLRAGDVILRYNGVEVQDDQHLVQLIGLSQIGETPRISILRNNAQILVTPQLITTSSAATER